MPLSYNHQLGLHLPLREGLEELVSDALGYNIAFFQFFLSQSQRKSKNIRPTQDSLTTFTKQIQSFSQSYIHSSYWINAATGSDLRFNAAKSILQKEIILAKKLMIPFLVLHPGSATWHKPTEADPFCRQGGIERLVMMLNLLLKKEHDITILLENTANGGRTVGSDFYDFVEIKKRLDFPERVGFCVDFAHAFSYGYDLSDNAFMHMLQETMGLDHIKLIHFNDSFEECGSKRDRHALPGAGLIGKKTLQKLLNHEVFRTIPKIIEVTNVSSKLIQQNLLDVSSW